MTTPLDKESLDLLGVESEAELGLPEAGETALVGGVFDAANRNERALALWHPPIQSADLDIVPAKGQLDARTRDVLRNDAYVRGGATIHQDNIVGSLYALNAKPMHKLLGAGFDEDWASEFQEEVETRFTLWAESPDNWADAARVNTFTDMVRLAVGVHTAGGEVLASVEWLRGGGRPFNTAIQFIDTDRLSTPPDGMNNPRLVAGIEKDKFGAPLKYHVRVSHPSDWRLMNNYKWKAVPVRKPWGRLQMIHIYEQQRPDQTRGIASMVSALKEMRTTKQFRDVVLQNAVVNATYAASIESDLPSVEAFATLGGTDDPGKALGAYSAAYAIASAADEITVARTGGVGSIGVMREHMEISRALEANGRTVTLIHAGDQKVDGHPAIPLSPEAKARMQERADALYQIFVSTVARNRGLDEQAVRGTEAGTFMAPQAVEKGLADAVGSLGSLSANADPSNDNDEDDEMSNDNSAVDQAAHDAAVAKATADGTAAGELAGATAERTRISAIMDSDEAKTRPAAARHVALNSDMNAEAAAAFLDGLPEEAKAPSNDDAANNGGNGFENAMNGSENPNLGAGGNETNDDEEASVSDGIFASIGQ